MKRPAVYIMSNTRRNVLYIGVTSNIQQRAYQHKHSLVDGYSKKYKCTDLVYYEEAPTMEEAIVREKQLKNWRREKKDKLVKTQNPELKDLYDTLIYM